MNQCIDFNENQYRQSLNGAFLDLLKSGWYDLFSAFYANELLGYYALDMFLAYSWINIGNMDTVTINDEQEVIYGLQFGDLEYDLDLYFQCQTAYDRSIN